MPELGPDLSARLDSEGNPDAAVAEIIRTPALLAECRAALPALKAVAEAKAGQDGVRRVVGKRFETYPQPQRTDEQWAAWWADYFDVLSDIGLASLEAGMRAYVAMPDSEFMPKPGRLRELAFSAPSRTLTRYYRASMAVREADRTPAEPRMTEAELAERRAELDAMVAESRKAATDWLAAHPRRDHLSRMAVQLPSIAGMPDETGITPQMRELRARQAQERQP